MDRRYDCSNVHYEVKLIRMKNSVCAARKYILTKSHVSLYYSQFNSRHEQMQNAYITIVRLLMYALHHTL